MKFAVSHVCPRAFRWAGGCLLAAFVLIAPALAQLPETMPAPPPRPGTEPGTETPARTQALEPPADHPVPTPRPEPSQAEDLTDKPPPGKAGGPGPMPAEELACRARLRELGVRFKERERLASDDGCLIAHPIAVTGLNATVAMEPEAILNCATARATAEFVSNVVSPRAQAAFGAPLTAIRHGSAYVCRTRNGQSKMSEHAFGNAIDFSAFELGDGTVIEVKAYGPGDLDRRDFLRGLRAAACGPFTTVLGPGADGDHADHLHLDLQERRRGGTWCR